MIDNLAKQSVLPLELIIVDGAQDTRTQSVIEACRAAAPFRCRYLRHGGGTAIQRNVGIDAASGDLIAFVDDDVRLEEDFFERVMEVLEDDRAQEIGGVIGYIANQFLDPATSPRWRWYRRLKLFSTYEPGRYDFKSGYPINRYLQPPHEGRREVDFMSTNCAVWRRQVFASGLRFSEFFAGFGILEDAHMALKARREWRLIEEGRARCIHLKAEGGRERPRSIARKSAVNYRYVFLDIVDDRTWRHEVRFWRVQVLDLIRFIVAALRSPRGETWPAVVGKVEGMWVALWMRAPRRSTERGS